MRDLATPTTKAAESTVRVSKQGGGGCVHGIVRCHNNVVFAADGAALARGKEVNACTTYLNCERR